MEKKKVIQGVMLTIAIIFNIIGIMSLLTVSKIAPIPFLKFYSNLNLIVAYIILIVFMSIGIMTFTAWAGTLAGKKKNIFSIGACTYSTILTIPLLITFILCFFAVNNTNMPMVGEITVAFMNVFKTRGLQYFIFAAGVLMSIIFLAVPIFSTYLTVKDLSIKDVFSK